MDAIQFVNSNTDIDNEEEMDSWMAKVFGPQLNLSGLSYREKMQKIIDSKFLLKICLLNINS